MSHERSSLIHDRCTTCGSLLPCDLHNRELKRVILSSDQEESPFDFVKKGLVSGAERAVASDRLFVPCGETGVLTLDKDNRLLIFKVDELQTEMRFVPLRDESGKEIVLEQNISQLTPYRTGYLFTYSGDTSHIWSLTPCVDGANSWEINKSDLRVNPGDGEFSAFRILSELTDGNFLVKGFSTRQQHLMLLQPPQSASDSWRVQQLCSDTEPIVASVRSKIVSELSNFVPFFDGTFLAGESLVQLKRYTNKKSNKWKVEDYVLPNRAILYRPLSSANNGIFSEVLSADERLFGDGENGIFLFRRGVNDEVDAEEEFHLTDNGIHETSPILTSVRRFTDDRFMLGGLRSFRDMSGLLELFERDKTGRWEKKTIFNGSESAVNEIFPLPTDPPSFLCAHIDGTITCWHISPEQLHAYHERQAAQTKTPPLPSDL